MDVVNGRMNRRKDKNYTTLHYMCSDGWFSDTNCMQF